MKNSLKFLLVIAFLLILPGLASAKDLTSTWGTDCPTFMSGQDCNGDYLNALGPKLCAPLATMNSRYSNCTTSLGGTLQCSGTCYWTSSVSYCDALNKNTTTVSQPQPGPAYSPYSAPNLNQCGGCKTGFTDISGTCTKIYDLAKVGSIWNAYTAVPTGGELNFTPLPFWDTDGNNVWRLTGNVGIGTATPFAKLHAEATDTWTVYSHVTGTVGAAIQGYAKDTATGKDYYGGLAILETDGGKHYGGSFQGPGGRVKIGTDTDAIQLVLGNLDVLENTIYNSGSLNVVHIGGKIELGDVATNTVSGDFAMAIGKHTTASGGYGAVAMNYYTTASGDASTAMGYHTTASGGYGATALNYYTEASGNSSISMGSFGVASAYNSVVMGRSSEASSMNAIAMGDYVTASGVNSVAMGENTTASAIGSVTMGVHTTAQSGSSLVIGRYNVLDGQDAWTGTDPLFVVGNGSDADNRANAFTVYKNGNVGVHDSSPDYPLDVQDSNYGAGEILSRFQGTGTVDMYGDGWIVVSGNARKPGAGSWLDTSDIRLKDVKSNFDTGLAAISQINPILFNYKKDNPYRYDSNIEWVGASAQEVQEVIPEAISADDKGYLQLSLDPVIWASVNAIKELKAENDALKAEKDAEIAQLKKVICELKPTADLCK